MTWYKKVLKDYSLETVISVSLILVILFALAIIQLVNGDVFEWKNITPIETPDIWVRLLYGALTYVSIGAFLYYIRFYQFLSLIFGGDRRGYREAKGIVWTTLLLLMFFVAIPVGVNILNSVISFLYNILHFIMYISPVSFIVLFLIVISITYRHFKATEKKNK